MNVYLYEHKKERTNEFKENENNQEFFRERELCFPEKEQTLLKKCFYNECNYI